MFSDDFDLPGFSEQTANIDSDFIDSFFDDSFFNYSVPAPAPAPELEDDDLYPF